MADRRRPAGQRTPRRARRMVRRAHPREPQ